MTTVTPVPKRDFTPVSLNSSSHAATHSRVSRIKNVGKYRANWPTGREEACWRRWSTLDDVTETTRREKMNGLIEDWRAMIIMNK